MENIDLDSLSNNSQVYIDAMNQLKNEYDKLQKSKDRLKKNIIFLLRTSLQIVGLSKSLNDLFNGTIDLPEEICGLLNILDDKCSSFEDTILNEYTSLLLQENENKDI